MEDTLDTPSFIISLEISELIKRAKRQVDDEGVTLVFLTKAETTGLINYFPLHCGYSAIKFSSAIVSKVTGPSTYS